MISQFVLPVAITLSMQLARHRYARFRITAFRGAPNFQVGDLAAAQAAFRTAKAEDHFAVRIQEKTGHKVTDESEKEAIEWFVKWLRP